MVYLLYFFYLVAAFVIVGTALPLIKEDAWWIRVFDFPRFQLAIIGFVLAVLLSVLYRPHPTPRLVLLGLIALAVVYQIIRILPYTPLGSKQVLPAERNKNETISMVITNVLMTNRSAQGLFNQIEELDPDLVLAMECDEWWQTKLEAISAEYPDKVLHPRPNTYGILLYSKYPLQGSEVKFLLEPDIPSIHTRVQLGSGRVVELRCVHPRPPAPQESDSTAKRDAELLVIGKEVKDLQDPVIVAGDLNDVAWSHTTTLFQRTSGLLDPRRGRGLYSTFDARNPFMRWPLDHVFHSKHFKLVDMKRLEDYGSDHFPVYIKLSLDPTAPIEQDSPDADNEERREAEEKIEEGIEAAPNK